MCFYTLVDWINLEKTAANKENTRFLRDKCTRTAADRAYFPIIRRGNR